MKVVHHKFDDEEIIITHKIEPKSILNIDVLWFSPFDIPIPQKLLEFIAERNPYKRIIVHQCDITSPEKTILMIKDKFFDYDYFCGDFSDETKRQISEKLQEKHFIVPPVFIFLDGNTVKSV